MRFECSVDVFQWRISDVLRRKWEPINQRQDLTDKLKIVSRALCRARSREWESYEREQNEKKPATVNNVEVFANKELCLEKNVSRKGHEQFFKLDGVELGETSKFERCLAVPDQDGGKETVLGPNNSSIYCENVSTIFAGECALRGE